MTRTFLSKLLYARDPSMLSTASRATWTSRLSTSASVGNRKMSCIVSARQMRVSNGATPINWTTSSSGGASSFFLASSALAGSAWAAARRASSSLSKSVRHLLADFRTPSSASKATSCSAGSSGGGANSTPSPDEHGEDSHVQASVSSPLSLLLELSANSSRGVLPELMGIAIGLGPSGAPAAPRQPPEDEDEVGGGSEWGSSLDVRGLRRWRPWRRLVSPPLPQLPGSCGSGARPTAHSKLSPVARPERTKLEWEMSALSAAFWGNNRRWVRITAGAE
mmetsp:Transcript_24588/g.49316  ORF Transcript_24588/g.49316 Transcript_24588/m.49316 type:complete len:279 (-) Transcript_24588:265-1101(-)